MKTIQSDYLRRHPRDVLNEVERGGEHFTVLRYQTPAAVIVPYGWCRAIVTAESADEIRERYEGYLEEKEELREARLWDGHA
jgi:Antitoxin Phd_YefM, type II toxin-antitoxin system